MAQRGIKTLLEKATAVPRPRWWKRAALSSSLVLLACIAGYYLGGLASAGLTQGSRQPNLVIVNGLAMDPRSLNLGEVWETPFHQFKLEVKNVSQQDRTIVDFSGTCGCVNVEPRRLTIPAGQKAELSLTVDLTHRLPHQVGLAQRPLSVRFNPVFEGDFASTPGWEIKGLVRSRVSLDSTHIPFTDQCIHAGPRVTRKVKAKAHVPVQRLEASAVPPVAHVQVESNSDTPDLYSIVVSPNPNLPIGPFSFEVQVRAVTVDAQVHLCASIEAKGEMQPSTTVFPRLILLGEHSLSDQAEADLSVRLPANGWTIDRFETDSPEAIVARTGMESDGTVKLRVNQRIGKVGDQTTHVRIVVRRPDQQTETVPVEVRYHGFKLPRPWVAAGDQGVPAKQP